MKKLALLMATVLTLYLPMTSFALENDEASYKNINGTLLYTDTDTSSSEQKDCVSSYNTIPSGLKNLMSQNGVKIYFQYWMKTILTGNVIANHI